MLYVHVDMFFCSIFAVEGEYVAADLKLTEKTEEEVGSLRSTNHAQDL